LRRKRKQNKLKSQNNKKNFSKPKRENSDASIRDVEQIIMKKIITKMRVDIIKDSLYFTT
jgi:hypothetical protein